MILNIVLFVIAIAISAWMVYLSYKWEQDKWK